MKALDLREYEGHAIGLAWEEARLDTYVRTNWVLTVDDCTFRLGQDAKFVSGVLHRDFAEFIHAAFLRAGIIESTPAKLAGDFDHDLLRTSLAVGIVEELQAIFGERGEDFLGAFQELDPLALSAG